MVLVHCLFRQAIQYGGMLYLSGQAGIVPKVSQNARARACVCVCVWGGGGGGTLYYFNNMILGR